MLPHKFCLYILLTLSVAAAKVEHVFMSLALFVCLKKWIKEFDREFYKIAENRRKN